jgi:hypothetical protein
LIKHLQSRFLVCSSAVILCLLLCTAWAPAQSKLPNGVYTAADASGFKKPIDDFINKHLDELKTGGPTMSTARDALVAQVGVSGATPSFVQVYSTSLAADMTAKNLAAAPDVRTRLNAAIVVARVAMVANNTAFADLATAFAQDKSEAVAIWGVKASQPIIPALLLGGNNAQALATAVINAVKAQPDSEVIPDDAYNALTMNEAARIKIKAAALKAYVAYPLGLLEYRVSLYQAGVPKSPKSDGLGTAYLAGRYGWGVMDSKQQSQTANLLVALANGAANQIEPSHGELISLIQAGAQALQTIARSMGDTAMESAAKDLVGIGQNSTKEDVQKKIKPVEDAVKARFGANAIAGQ